MHTATQSMAALSLCGLWGLVHKSTAVKHLATHLHLKRGRLYLQLGRLYLQRGRLYLHIEKDNRKTQAEFICQSCGHSENADKNADKVILNRYLHELEKAT